MHPLSAIPILLLTAAPAVIAQEPTVQNAGFGAIYRDIELDPVTNNVTHLGVVVDTSTGHFLVSGSGPGSPSPHWIFELDGTGQLVQRFNQPAVHSVTGFGIRDLAFDGSSLIGGSEMGISVFSTSGVLVNQIDTQNGPYPIVQPITGQVAAQLTVFRAIALDKAGNGGNGSLLVADFGSPIYEIDFAGNILATFPNLGWSAYGLAIDPVTGNPWVYAGPSGQIEELDRATMVPTGRRLAPIAPGAQGGLALASPIAGHHEPWATQSSLVYLVQGTTDRIAVQRLHLFPGVHGWDEIQLQTGVNGGPMTTGVAPFWVGDMLDYRPVDPTGMRNGLPVWIIFNIYLDANRDAYTDASLIWPGSGMLFEHRSLNTISLPGSAYFLITTGTIGSTTSWAPPASLALMDRDLYRVQAVYIEPASSQNAIASTNEAHWQAQAGERGIVISASGSTSFNAGLAPPFWQVSSDATHNHGAIMAVEISTIGANSPGSLLQFDIDQNSMGDRFDGGNSTQSGFLGTYRSGSDHLCGLDYNAASVYVAPFHVPTETSGVSFSVPPDPFGYVPDLRFAFTQFTASKAFVFDCDTDGGTPNGAGHAGLVVRITTTNSGVLTGMLAVDPLVPNRSVVWFP